VLDLFPPTEQQRAVINHRKANLLVLAGPGTGKTETLARRFAALVAEGIPAQQILVLTFSRRAVDEMRDRILLRLRQVHQRGIAVSELYVKTFHSFCSRLLEADGARQARRELLTPVRERLLWRRLMQSASVHFESFDASLKDSAQFATDCLNVIGQLKGYGKTPEDLGRIAGGDARLRDIAAMYAGMERERQALGLHDFRDLVNQAVRELRNPSSDAARWLVRADFAHVLVDEFQDSDPMQLELLKTVRAVLGGKPDFCFVGDKNQSIYRFRGASPGNIDAAAREFDCEALLLHDNRRSAPVVLQAANDDRSLDESSVTQAADAGMRGLVQLRRARTIEQEVRLITEAIARRLARGTAPRNIAVLLRQTHPYQELLHTALRAAGIAVATSSTAGFHEDALIDGVLSALRTLAAPGEQNLWRRLLCNPILGFVPISVQCSFDAGRSLGESDPQSILAANPPRGVRPIRSFLSAWRTCHDAFAHASPAELVRTIVRELDLLRPVRESNPVLGFDANASPQRLAALLQAAEDYSQESSDGASALAEFIDRLDETVGLLSDSSQPPPATTDGVRVISIHAAKGLEFDFVVIPQLIDGVLPARIRPNRLLSGASIARLREAGADIFVDDDAARSEEHALFYVALTRARFEVLATAPCVDDDGVDVVPSSFAGAIEKVERNPSGPLLDWSVPEPTSGAGAAAGAAGGTGQAVSLAAMRRLPPIRLPIDALSPTSVGTFLVCPRRFYYGEVLRLPRRDDEATAYGLRLHQILARFHERETDFENVTGEEQAFIAYNAALAKIADEIQRNGQNSGGPLARFEREDLMLRLAQYARALAREACHHPFRVVGCEVAVRFTLDEFAIRGKVDRVDRLPSGELVIRDYKSGRLPSALAKTLRQAFARLDDGEFLFGDAPKGLNLQTILYVPAVEEQYGARVRRLDYLYFRGRKVGESDLLIESTEIVDSDQPSTEGQQITRADVARATRDIAARIAQLCSAGALTQFPTTDNEETCRRCEFARVCPGSGAIPA
jgi:superfamily I DNA/RNA helicase/CRISPR/Cas system-associated exonuclease Cas4 (RecB family)